MSKFSNLTKAHDYEVRDWLIKAFKFTDYQKSLLRSNEDIIRYAPFKFYKRKPKQDNMWIRLTLVFVPLVWLIMILGLPLNFILTGIWGYPNNKVYKFIMNWFHLLRL